MRTESQIQASRLNGAKSRGPKTSEGKARSAQNATRHGFLAKTLVLNTESQAAFDDLLTTFDGIMKPRDGFEHDIVAIMVASRWRSRRLLAVESSGTDGEIEKLNQPNEPAARTASKAFRNRSDSSVPDLIRRLDEGYTRQLIRAYDLLMRYRHDNILGYGPGLPAPVESAPESEPTKTETNPSAPAQPAAKPVPIRVAKIGRNEPCPCQSGLKFKRCCLNNPTQPTTGPPPPSPFEPETAE